ncbi:S-layer protein domain-containing protein [Methanolobus sp. ZRKC3]|uniref:S-layer protein domain-containing protein n=1 Tax=Methanolobus sp. ZRKC3 TaxID=3125786 RepID=UPI003244EFCE
MKKTIKLVLMTAFLLLALNTFSTAAAAANNSTGNLIWDADDDLSLEYTWTALSYSGFYFDLDSGEGSETLIVKLDSDSDRSINDGDLEYITSSIETDFEQNDWGSYQVIGFMAEQYFAAYSDDTEFARDDISLMSDGELSKVLIDSDEKKSLFTGSSLILEEGYELNIVEVDMNGNNLLVSLEKDGKEIDIDVISGDDTYVYITDLGSNEDVPMIAVHFDDIFMGSETNAVFIDGIFQISENFMKIEADDEYGEMEVNSIGDDKITMRNYDSISLGRGDTVKIMGKLRFIVADDNTLRFGPVVDMSEPGTYELRGTVAEDEELKWTPLNFEGFYYNIDEGIGTESLEVEDLNGRTIEKGDLVYKSKAQDVSFEHNEWGEFQVVGFLAQKYFAGYPDNEFTNDVSILSDGQLSEVLIDTDKQTTLYTGSSLILEDGYELKIVEVDLDGSSVMVRLVKYGSELDTGIISSDDDYVYEKDIGSTDDVPVIVVHFNEIFSGSESNAVFVEGIFQVSEDVIEIVSDEMFGEMTVDSFSSDEVILENEDSISLTRDDTIEIMGDISFKVANSGDVRYYPFVEVSTLPSESLSIDMPKVIKENEKTAITVESRGATVEDAVVTFGDIRIGDTSNEGIIPYTPTTAGIYTVKAEKEGFVSATFKVEVISPDDVSRKLVIEVSPDNVVEQDTITISTVTAIGGESVEDVEVYFDGNLIGTSDEDGMLTYTVKEPGVHKLSTRSDEYLEAKFNLEIDVLEARFTYSELIIAPLLVKTKEEFTVSANVTNTGTAKGDTLVQLMINGTVADAKSISLDVGEETSVEFTTFIEEKGSYEVQLGAVTGNIEVEKKLLTAPGIFLILALLAGVAMFVMKKNGKGGIEGQL